MTAAILVLPGVAAAQASPIGQLIIDLTLASEHIARLQAAQRPPVAKAGKAYYLDLISRYSAKYDVSEGLMVAIVDCETARTWNPYIQSGHILRSGNRERSYGLAQINLVYHPDVTYDQATSPEFALNFLAKNLAAGNRSWWTCPLSTPAPKREFSMRY